MVVVPPTFKLPLDAPETFNEDKNVDALETEKLEKLVLLFKLLIDYDVDVEKVEKVLTST